MPNTPSPRPARSSGCAQAHRLRVRLLGPPGGTPRLVLHGGPGSGCAPSMADWFDWPATAWCCRTSAARAARARPARSGATPPARCWTTRSGCGAPSASSAGTWRPAPGARWPRPTPPATRRMWPGWLRGSFLTRRDDILRLFSAGARRLDAGAARPCCGAHTAGRGTGAAAATVQLLQNGTPVQQRDTAWRWRRVETGLLAGRPARRSDGADRAGALARGRARRTRAVPQYRIQARYLPRRCGLARTALLRCGGGGRRRASRSRCCTARATASARRAMPSGCAAPIHGGRAVADRGRTHWAHGAMAPGPGRPAAVGMTRPRHAGAGWRKPRAGPRRMAAAGRRAGRTAHTPRRKRVRPRTGLRRRGGHAAAHCY